MNKYISKCCGAEVEVQNGTGDFRDSDKSMTHWHVCLGCKKACDIMNKKAIEKIYRIKQRNKNKPFSFICSDLKNISNYAKVSNYAYKTMKRLLPGPYTFILEGSRMVPKIMLTKRKTAGIRVPDHEICLRLVEGLENPIISTSASMPDGEIIHDPSLLHDHFGVNIDLVIDGGPVSDEPSSVVSLINDEPEVFRKGLGDVSSFE